MNKFFISSLIFFTGITQIGYSHGGGGGGGHHGSGGGGGYHGGGGGGYHGGGDWHGGNGYHGGGNWHGNGYHDGGDWRGHHNDWNHNHNNYYWYGGGTGWGWGAGFYNPIYVSTPAYVESPTYVAQPYYQASYPENYQSNYSQSNTYNNNQTQTLPAIPTFTLKVETPTVTVGNKAIIRIISGRGKDPVTIYWKTENNDWVEGGPDFEQIATTPGTLTISTVVKDGDGKYSEPQISKVQVNGLTASTQYGDKKK